MGICVEGFKHAHRRKSDWYSGGLMQRRIERIGWGRGMGSTGVEGPGEGLDPPKNGIVVEWRVLVNSAWAVFFENFGTMSISTPLQILGTHLPCSP